MLLKNPTPVAIYLYYKPTMDKLISERITNVLSHYSTVKRPVFNTHFKKVCELLEAQQILQNKKLFEKYGKDIVITEIKPRKKFNTPSIKPRKPMTEEHKNKLRNNTYGEVFNDEAYYYE